MLLGNQPLQPLYRLRHLGDGSGQGFALRLVFDAVGQGTIFSPVTALGQGLEGVPQLSGLFVRQPGEGQLVQLAGEGGGDQLFHRLFQGILPLKNGVDLVIDDLVLGHDVHAPAEALEPGLRSVPLLRRQIVVC